MPASCPAPALLGLLELPHRPVQMALPTTHYWMNSLQGVSQRENYFVSLNAEGSIAPEQVLRRIEYEHPLFSLGAIAAQTELPQP